MKNRKPFRSLFAAALACLCAAPLPALQEELPFPEGWRVRFDREAAKMEDLRFVEMSPGMHVTTGPAMIAYHPDSTAAGAFRIESETFLFDPKGRREAFGFFVGGADLEGEDQRYVYFLIRDGGEFLVKTRDGALTREIHPWTAHSAIGSWDESGATVKNTLALEVSEGAVRFLVNDQLAWSGNREDLQVDGVFGLRVNHGLNLHVTTIASKNIEH